MIPLTTLPSGTPDINETVSQAAIIWAGGAQMLDSVIKEAVGSGSASYQQALQNLRYWIVMISAQIDRFKGLGGSGMEASTQINYYSQLLGNYKTALVKAQTEAQLVGLPGAARSVFYALQPKDLVEHGAIAGAALAALLIWTFVK